MFYIDAILRIEESNILKKDYNKNSALDSSDSFLKVKDWQHRTGFATGRKHKPADALPFLTEKTLANGKVTAAKTDKKWCVEIVYWV